MNKILVSLNGKSDYQVNKQEYDFIIAVDGGYEFLIKQGIKPNLLVGDQDSIKVQSVQCEILKFPSEKDETDFELTINYIKQNFTNYHIDVVNYKSQFRIEHFLTNLRLIESNITFIDEYSIVKQLDPGSYTISKIYDYISLFALTQVEGITIENVKYPLVDYCSNSSDTLMISNEIIGDKCKVSFKSGKLLVIQSVKD